MFEDTVLTVASKDSGETIVYKTTVTYTCAGGYFHTNGDLIRKCQANGQLNGISPTCARVTCSVPDVEDTLKNSGTTIVYNMTVTYTCAEGYIVTNGSLVRTCQADGQLDGTSPTCTPECGTVPAVPYSTYTPPNNRLLGACVTYLCDSGYSASGADTIECLTSGWTTRPFCHPDVGYNCTDTSCTDPNAVCDGDTLLCSCPTGYFDSNGGTLGGKCEVKSTEVSTVLIVVPIACVVVAIQAVSIACFFKPRRKRLEADHGNNNTRIAERNAISLQMFNSEQDYDNIGETNNPEGNYNTETYNMLNNTAYVCTECTPVAHVPQTNIDAAIIAHKYTDEHNYETLQDPIYLNTELNGEA